MGIRLPRDGADYHCTYNGCGKVTTMGLSMDDYNLLLKITKPGVESFMCALCDDHLYLLEAFAAQYRAENEGNT